MNADLRRNYLLRCLSFWYLQLDHAIMSIIPLSPAWERVPFSVYSLVLVKVRPVLKNCSCSWSAQSTRLPLFACAFLSTRRSIQASTLLYGFGGDKVLHITLFSTLYVTLSQHTRLLRLSEFDCVSGFWTNQNMWHYGLLLHFLLPYFHPSWGFVIYGYLTGALNRSKRSFHSLSRFLNYNNKPGTSTLALLK